MAPTPEHRYRISEVSVMTEVPDYVLRQWEKRFTRLHPRRDRQKRRYYLEKDIEIVRRIKTLVWHEKMTTEGAEERLEEELVGAGRPRTGREAMDLINKIEAEVLAMLDAIEEKPSPD